jgi:DNA/RNA endonuclease YhcR with UshA esterase domain
MNPSITRVAVNLALALVAAFGSTALAQETNPLTVPRYDLASEATFKGIVTDVIDRQCPVTGGLGAHLMLKVEGGKVIEVHLAATKFMKDLDFVFNKGDRVEVVGVKVQFEGKETIFARQVTRGTETFAFRDPNGGPIW